MLEPVGEKDIMQITLNNEIGAALGKFFFGGKGPSHSELTNVFTVSGYAECDPYDSGLGSPNKTSRVQTVVTAASRNPHHALKLVVEILSVLRVHGCFDSDSQNYDSDSVKTAQRAFMGSG